MAQEGCNLISCCCRCLLLVVGLILTCTNPGIAFTSARANPISSTTIATISSSSFGTTTSCSSNNACDNNYKTRQDHRQQTCTGRCSVVPATTTFLSSNSRLWFQIPPRGGAQEHEDRSATTTTTTTTKAASYQTNLYNLGATAVPQESTATSTNKPPMNVLFLSSDTGGGHRASAESLAKQFVVQFPGSTYELVDLWRDEGTLPYRSLVDAYKHLSAHPNQWRFLYHLSNTMPWTLSMDVHSHLLNYKRIRRRLEKYDPDVIVSVHPTMNNVPRRVMRQICKERNKHIPFFTVVTDLASGHNLWFQSKVERLYLASEQLRKLARRRGRTPNDKIVMSGLPIRYDFAVQADKMGDRHSAEGVSYRKTVKKDVNVDPQKPMILIMGGGEGVGSLSKITSEVFIELTRRGLDATLCVVTGRNEKLKAELEERDWDALYNNEIKKQIARVERGFFRRGSGHVVNDYLRARGNVEVKGLGFVTNMADYMVAADVLVSKAGPGTIAEAASVQLPVLLTSFLPGQESGNVDFVIENGFGAYQRKPRAIAAQVADWIQNPDQLLQLSEGAKKAGNPYAAAEIVADIAAITHHWMELNEQTKQQQ